MNEVITAPKAPQVPMLGKIGPPMQQLPFGKQGENENLTCPAMEFVEESEGWVLWDLSKVLQHLSTNKGPAPMCYYSPYFYYSLGQRLLKWQVCFAAIDFDRNHASLYLGSFDCKSDDKLLLETNFSLQLSYQVEDKKQYQDIADNIQHVYQARSYWFGIQRMLNTKDINCRGRVKVGLKISECRRIGTHLNHNHMHLICKDPFIFQISQRPFIICLENFLSSSECDRIIQLAEPHLSPSLVQSGGLTKHRQSSSMFFVDDLRKFALVREVEARLLSLVNIDVVLNGHSKQKPQETLQVIHYKEREFYRAHLDNRDNEQPIRAATIIVYLNDVEEGGCTYFKLAHNIQTDKTEGVRIHPRKGRLLMFWNRETNSYQQDLQTLHEAEPTIKGEKWILTRWFRDEFTPTYSQWMQRKEQQQSYSTKIFKKWQNSCDRIILSAAAPLSNKTNF